MVLIGFWLILSTVFTSCVASSPPTQQSHIQSGQENVDNVGIPNELMRRFTVVLIVQEETMREAVIRMMKEELLRFERSIADEKQNEHTAVVKSIDDKIMKKKVAVSGSGTFSNRTERFYYWQDVDYWNGIFSERFDWSPSVVYVSFECADTGPVFETIRVSLIVYEKHSEIRQLCPTIPKYRSFMVSELPHQTGKLIVDRIRKEWEMEIACYPTLAYPPVDED